jgi:hypothetical protein
MNKILLSILLLLTASCAAMETMLYGAGGAAAGSLAGPGGAAAGAVVGIGAAELQQADRAQTDLAAQAQELIPKTPWESFVDSTANLLHTLGWWYLIIFIFVPLLTKKGRSWMGHLIGLHNTATKKDVDEYSTRLNKLEGMISSLTKEKE